MSSETEEDLRGDKSHVSDLQYYTGSPLSGTATWTQSDIDQATAIGETYVHNFCPDMFLYMSIEIFQSNLDVLYLLCRPRYRGEACRGRFRQLSPVSPCD